MAERISKWQLEHARAEGFHEASLRAVQYVDDLRDYLAGVGVPMEIGVHLDELATRIALLEAEGIDRMRNALEKEQ